MGGYLFLGVKFRKEGKVGREGMGLNFEIINCCGRGGVGGIR